MFRRVRRILEHARVADVIVGETVTPRVRGLRRRQNRRGSSTAGPATKRGDRPRRTGTHMLQSTLGRACGVHVNPASRTPVSCRRSAPGTSTRHHDHGVALDRRGVAHRLDGARSRLQRSTPVGAGAARKRVTGGGLIDSRTRVEVHSDRRREVTPSDPLVGSVFAPSASSSSLPLAKEVNSVRFR
jgi:hypothetical protein